MKTFTIKNYVTVPVEIEIEAESLDAAKKIAMNYDITESDIFENGDFTNLGQDEMWTITDEESNEYETI